MKRLSGVAERNPALQKELQEKTDLLKQAELALRDALTNAATLRSQLATNEEQRQSLAQQLDLAQQANAELAKEHADLQALQNLLNSELEQTRSDLHARSEQVTRLEKANEGLQKDVTELESRHDEDARNLEEQRLLAEQRAKELAQEQEARRLSELSLQGRITLLNSDVSDLTNRLNASAKTLKSQEEELTSAHHELEQLGKSAQKLEALQKQFLDLSVEKRALEKGRETDAENLKSVNDSLNALRNQFIEFQRKAEEDLKQQLAAKQRAFDDLQTLYGQAQEKILSIPPLTNELRRAQKQVTDLEEQLRHGHEENRVLQERIEKNLEAHEEFARTARDDLNAIKVQMASELDRLRQDFTKQANRIGELEIKNETLQKRHEEDLARYQELEDAHQRSQKAALDSDTALKGQISRLESAQADMSSEYKKITEENTLLKHEHETLRALNSGALKIGDKQAEEIRTLTAELARVTETKDSEISSARELQIQTAEALRKNEEQLEIAASRITELERLNKVLNDQLIAARGELETLQAQHRTDELTMRDQADRIEKLMLEQQKDRLTIEQLRDRLSEKEKEAKVSLNTQSRLQKMADDSGTEASTFRDQQDDLKRRNAQLEKEITVLRQSLKTQEEALSYEKDKLPPLLTLLQTATQERQDLASQLKEARKSNTAFEARLKELEDLKGQLDTSRAEVSTLRPVQEENTKLQAQNHRLNETLETLSLALKTLWQKSEEAHQKECESIEALREKIDGQEKRIRQGLSLPRTSPPPVDYTDEIKALQTEIEGYQARQAEFDKQQEAIIQNYERALEATIHENTLQLQDAANENLELGASIRSLGSEKAQLKFELQKQFDERQSLSASLTLANDLLSKKLKEIEELKGYLVTSGNEKRKQKEEIDALTTALSNRNIEIQELKRSLQQQKIALEAMLKDKHSEHEIKVADLREQIEYLQTRVQEKEASELKTLYDTIRRGFAEIIGHQPDETSASELFDRTKERIAALRLCILAVKRENIKLERALQVRDKKIEKIIKERDQLIDNLQRSEERNEMMQKAHQEAIRRLEQALKDKDSHIFALESDFKVREQYISELEHRCSMFFARLGTVDATTSTSDPLEHEAVLEEPEEPVNPKQATVYLQSLQTLLPYEEQLRLAAVWRCNRQFTSIDRVIYTDEGGHAPRSATTTVYPAVRFRRDISADALPFPDHPIVVLNSKIGELCTKENAALFKALFCDDGLVRQFNKHRSNPKVCLFDLKHSFPRLHAFRAVIAQTESRDEEFQRLKLSVLHQRTQERRSLITACCLYSSLTQVKLMELPARTQCLLSCYRYDEGSRSYELIPPEDRSGDISHTIDQESRESVQIGFLMRDLLVVRSLLSLIVETEGQEYINRNEHLLSLQRDSLALMNQLQVILFRLG